MASTAVITLEERICKGCGPQPLQNFRTHKRSATKKTYYSSYCKTCDNERVTAWSRNNPEKVAVNKRNSDLRKYGLTLSDVLAMLEKQNYKCFRCQEPIDLKTKQIDHDHSCCPEKKSSCGVCIRGLACKACNLSEGIFKGDAERIRRFAESFGVTICHQQQ